MKKLYDNVYLASFGRKVIKLRFDLFDASLVRRSAQQTILTILARPKLEFGLSHEKLDIGSRPNSAYIRILRSDQELACSRGTCVRGGFSCSSPV